MPAHCGTHHFLNTLVTNLSRSNDVLWRSSTLSYHMLRGSMNLTWLSYLWDAKNCARIFIEKTTMKAVNLPTSYQLQGRQDTVQGKADDFTNKTFQWQFYTLLREEMWLALRYFYGLLPVPLHIHYNYIYLFISWVFQLYDCKSRMLIKLLLLPINIQLTLMVVHSKIYICWVSSKNLGPQETHSLASKMWPWDAQENGLYNHVHVY